MEDDHGRKKSRGLEYENNLKKIRAAAGFSQRELARHLDKPQTFISKIEAGNILPANMSLRNAYKLAEALGCRLEDLIGMPYLECTLKCNG